MFLIHASAEDLTQIDIIGQIGEDFFGDGNTLESVQSQIRDIKTPLTVKISSLGGDLIQGLAIHDLLASHPHHVTTDIIASTASAGTIVAMGGDKVIMSEHSMFLGHGASVTSGGNAEELRKKADTLDKFDAQQISIYKKKTRKPIKDIKELMMANSWITAKQALEFGFVDEIYKPSKVMAQAEIDNLKIDGLPEIPQAFIENLENKMENNESSLKSSILALVGFKNDEVLKAENIALKEKITALEAEQPTPVDTTEFTTEIENLKSEIQAKADYDTIKAELETVKADLEKAKAGTVIIASADPSPDGNEPPAPVANPFPLSEGTKQLFEQAKFYTENK